MAQIEYQLALINQVTPTCDQPRSSGFQARGDSIYVRKLEKQRKKDCPAKIADFNKKHKDNMDQLLAHKYQILKQQPLLNHEVFQKWLTKKVEKRQNKYQKKNSVARQKILPTALSYKNKELARKAKKATDLIRAEAKKDTTFKTPGNFRKLYKEAVTDATRKLKELKTRHKKVVSSIDTVFNKKYNWSSHYIKRVRDDIYNDRKLMTDYYTTTNPQDLEESSMYRLSSCRVKREYDVIERNSFITSTAADIGTLLIPGGAWFIGGKLLTNAARLANVAMRAKKINTIRSAIVPTLFASEGLAVGLDITNISSQMAHCKSIQETALVYGSVPAKYKIQYRQCKENENMLTVYAGLALVGGIAGTVTVPSILANKARKLLASDKLFVDGRGVVQLKIKATDGVRVSKFERGIKLDGETYLSKINSAFITKMEKNVPGITEHIKTVTKQMDQAVAEPNINSFLHYLQGADSGTRKDVLSKLKNNQDSKNFIENVIEGTRKCSIGKS